MFEIHLGHDDATSVFNRRPTLPATQTAKRSKQEVTTLVAENDHWPSWPRQNELLLASQRMTTGTDDVYPREPVTVAFRVPIGHSCTAAMTTVIWLPRR